MSNKQIRNLELELISEDESFIMTREGKELKSLGKQIIRKYKSEIGDLEIHELLDNKGKREEYFFIDDADLKTIKELYNGFYGCDVMFAPVYNPEKTNQINEQASKN